jgi:hypothetical protein
MREKINALYYPEFAMDPATLKRSIILFDELHVMDRPSFSFGGRDKSNFGMIGADSPLRQFEQSFREEGMPLYVHGAPGGRIAEEDYSEVSADINDMEYLRRFQKGLETSEAFRRLQIPPANYGEVGNQDGVVRALLGVDLATAFSEYDNPIQMLEDKNIQLFRFSTPDERAKGFLNHALMCAIKLNLALHVGVRYGHQPLADAAPFGDLLGAKYARAIAVADKVTPKIQLTDLTFAIFDELLPAKRLEKMSIKDLISYRKSSAEPREAFLEHMASLHAKASQIKEGGAYQAAIENILTTEIRPAARDFQNALAKINDGFVTSLAKGVISTMGGSSLVQFFGALSWGAFLPLAAAGAAYIGNAALDAYLADRATRRESSISYILSLD